MFLRLIGNLRLFYNTILSPVSIYLLFCGWIGLTSSGACLENSRPAPNEHKARRSTPLRRDFSVSNIFASPSAIQLKGMGVPIGEGKPNATSTAAREETGLSQNASRKHPALSDGLVPRLLRGQSLLALFYPCTMRCQWRIRRFSGSGFYRKAWGMKS
jgi:hypothetical protein